MTLSTESWSDLNKIKSVVGVNSEILNNDGSKLVLNIPNNPELPNILDTVDIKKKELGITGMSVSPITLEQVFLR